MHELSVCQSIIQQVIQVALDHHASQVSKVTVQIGPLSGVEAVLLEQAFPFASAGSVAENAQLICERLPVRIRCSICRHENEAPANKLICEACGSWQTQLLSGDEMILTSIELEKEDNNV